MSILLGKSRINEGDRLILFAGAVVGTSRAALPLSKSAYNYFAGPALRVGARVVRGEAYHTHGDLYNELEPHELKQKIESGFHDYRGKFYTNKEATEKLRGKGFKVAGRLHSSDLGDELAEKSVGESEARVTPQGTAMGSCPTCESADDRLKQTKHQLFKLPSGKLVANCMRCGRTAPVYHKAVEKGAGPRGMRIRPLGDSKKLQRNAAFAQWGSFIRPHGPTMPQVPEMPSAKKPKMPKIPMPPMLAGVIKSAVRIGGRIMMRVEE